MSDPAQELVSFEWDEKKRRGNIANHGIDFEDAALALQQPRLEVRSDRNGEVRTLAICQDTNRLIAIIYTMRDGNCRIISARATRQHEQQLYNERYP
jgi:uncharacterized DUF497 family protein